MPRSPNETVQSNFRLTRETIALLDGISDYYGLRSRSDAIRVAARVVYDGLPEKKRESPPEPT